MSTGQNYCNTILRLHRTFKTNRGRPCTDTPFVILKSWQPIGDDPNLCMALNLTNNLVRYSKKYPWICISWWESPFSWFNDELWKITILTDKSAMNEAMQMVDRVKRDLLGLHEGWLVVWNIFHFSIYWEFHHPHWLSLHHFSEG